MHGLLFKSQADSNAGRWTSSRLQQSPHHSHVAHHRGWCNSLVDPLLSPTLSPWRLMDWAAPQLRRFDFRFPPFPAVTVPTAEPPDHAQSAHTSPHCSFDVVCYGASSSTVLSLTHTSHPLFRTHCYTGLQAYSGAEVLARMIVRQPQVLQRGRAVLEIGCGIGLTGVVAARCMSQPALHSTTATAQPLLVLTDGEDDAVRLTRCNLTINLLGQQQPDEPTALHFLQSSLAMSAEVALSTRCAPSLCRSPSQPELSPAVSVHAVAARWDAVGASSISSYCERAVGRPVRFDVIYGTDLIYAKTSIADILSFALQLLSDTGILLLAHTPRIAQLHSMMRSECRQRALTIKYVRSALISRAEEVERGWTQVELLIITTDSGWEALQNSVDWQWAEFEDVGRVERQLAEVEREYADDSLALSALTVSADDL